MSIKSSSSDDANRVHGKQVTRKEFRSSFFFFCKWKKVFVDAYKSSERKNDKDFTAHAICEWRRQVLSILIQKNYETLNQLQIMIWVDERNEKESRENNCGCKQNEVDKQTKKSLKIIYSRICCHHCAYKVEKESSVTVKIFSCLQFTKLDAKIMH